MYPHERSLVKKMENKPFALLGINSDPKDHLRETLKKESMTWRSWWDESTDGRIARAWNVHGWPTTYVLDHKGVIRFKDVRDAEMDKAVEQLVAEVEQGERAATEK
jgi:peroxiredoxin